MINRLVIGGNLTRDAELRDVGEQQVCSFRIGHTPYKKDAFFVDVSVWGRRAEALAEHLSKGTAVVVDGTFSVRTYEHNGETRTAFDLRADDVQFAGSRPRDHEDDHQHADAEGGDSEGGDDDDYIKF